MSVPVLIAVLVFTGCCLCGVLLLIVAYLLEFAREAKEAVEGRLARIEAEERAARREEAVAYRDALAFEDKLVAYEQRRAERIGAEAEAFLAAVAP